MIEAAQRDLRLEHADSVTIYPPPTDRDQAFAAASPNVTTVAYATFGKSATDRTMQSSSRTSAGSKRWPAIVDIVHLRELVRDVDRAGANPVTRLASRFMGLTGQRPGMIRTMP